MPGKTRLRRGRTRVIHRFPTNSNAPGHFSPHLVGARVTYFLHEMRCASNRRLWWKTRNKRRKAASAADGLVSWRWRQARGACGLHLQAAR
ncbi:hypothetical protein [Lysobacter gummosus]|uniref:hypothetical protein n=1 Tax=Lysobacter gummosus TaxID=262324 RepID=UPI0036405400